VVQTPLRSRRAIVFGTHISAKAPQAPSPSTGRVRVGMDMGAVSMAGSSLHPALPPPGGRGARFFSTSGAEHDRQEGEMEADVV
jgi:hypothetical protein